jgi:mitogen-activated protein kinase kinase
MASPPDPSGVSETDTKDFAMAPMASALEELAENAPQPESEVPAESPDKSIPHRIPSIRSISDPPHAAAANMSSSSNPLGVLSTARRPPNASPSLSGIRSVGGGGLPQDMAAKMRAFHASRQGTPPGGRPSMPPASSASSTPPLAPSAGIPGLPGGLRLPPTMRPTAQASSSAPVVPRMGAKPSRLQERAAKFKGALSGASGPATPTLDLNGKDSAPASQEDHSSGSMFAKYSKIVDTEKGTLKFDKAVIHGQGIDFSSGSSFKISLDEVETLEELGKGNYGTVYKVRHAKPAIRKPGMGLQGNKVFSSSSPVTPAYEKDEALQSSLNSKAGTSGAIMGMKEIRLELDEAKFAAIIMELDILHRCVSPYIIDFYGAFFQEGAVYICMEFMDGGSIDKLYGDGIPENILRKITYSTTQGLKSLKDGHNIIHRDVKPTNILVNTRGQVKICDFGVSGNLVASIAKTNIGCQSYMAPERIAGGGVAQAGANPGGGTYSVQSDIWSLGLSIIECAIGRYPYPPETYNNIFSQLSVSAHLELYKLPS